MIWSFSSLGAPLISLVSFYCSRNFNILNNSFTQFVFEALQTHVGVFGWHNARVLLVIKNGLFLALDLFMILRVGLQLLSWEIILSILILVIVIVLTLRRRQYLVLIIHQIILIRRLITLLLLLPGGTTRPILHPLILHQVVVELLDFLYVNGQILIPLARCTPALASPLLRHILDIARAIKPKRIAQPRYLLLAVVAHVVGGGVAGAAGGRAGDAIWAVGAAGVAELLAHWGVFSAVTRRDFTWVGPVVRCCLADDGAGGLVVTLGLRGCCLLEIYWV